MLRLRKLLSGHDLLLGQEGCVALADPLLSHTASAGAAAAHDDLVAVGGEVVAADLAASQPGSELLPLPSLLIHWLFHL